MPEPAPPPTRSVGARPPGGPTPFAPGHVVAVGAGLAAAGTVVAVRQAGGLDGLPGLTAAVLLALALPTSRLLARRMLVAGAFVFGLAPLLWLWDLPVDPVGRITLVMASVAGALTTSVLWNGRAGVGLRLRRLVPRLRPVDALPGFAACASAWVTWSWLRVATGRDALAMLVPGWDNSAHYDMVSMIRRHGVTVDRLADIPPEHWQFGTYPQGFHSVVAAVMETIGSPVVQAQGLELVGYVQALGWVIVLATTMLVAGLTALPWLRRRPLVALPVAAGVVAAVTLGPGGTAYTTGFPNFVVAAALAGCVPLLVVTMPRVVMPLHLAVLGSLLVGVAQSWLLLLVVAGPAAMALALPVRRRSWTASRTARLACGVVAAATLVGLVSTLRTIVSLDAAGVLVLPGGIAVSNPGLTVAVALAAVAASLMVGTRDARLTWTALGPVAGLVALTLLGVLQQTTSGELSYYFWKLLVGVELVAVIVLAAAVARAASLWRTPSGRGARPSLAVALVAASLAATQVFGYTGTGRGVFTDRPEHAVTAETVLQAADTAQASPAPYQTLLTGAGSTIHPVSAQQWFLALTGRWTAEANNRAESLVTATGAPVDLVTAARDALRWSADASVVVSPTDAEAVRAGVGPRLAPRVLTWP